MARLAAPRKFSLNRLKSIGFLLSAMVGLVGCVPEPPGLSGSATARYATIAVVPSATDDILSVYWPSALSDPRETEGRMGGKAASLVGRSASSLLRRAGADVSITDSVGSTAARKSDAVVVLRQAPIDRMGLVYDPGRDFLVAGAGLYGLFVIAAGESKKETRFKPRTVIQIRNPAKSTSLMGDNMCFFGLKPALVDPQTGKVTKEGNVVVAHETIPTRLTAQHWAALNRAEKSAVRAACQVALQKAVSMALARLDIAT